jgi:agmatinase
MTHPLFLGSEFAQYPKAHAAFHVIPVPYEATVSYGTGTASGPAAILEASNQLEVFDGTSTPGEEGIHTYPAVDCTGEAHTVFERIHNAVTAALTVGKERRGIPVLLGGEHSITTPAVDALQAHLRNQSPDEPAPIGLIQIDAHADLRDTYDGSPHSHACIARRVHGDLKIPLLQIGVRSLSPEEVIYRAAWPAGSDRPILHHDAATIVPGQVTAITLPEDFPRHAYLTIDVDGLDSSIIPATGTPVPGGLSWYQTLSILESLSMQTSIDAFDVVELAPMQGMHGCNYTAADLTYRVMGILARSTIR